MFGKTGGNRPLFAVSGPNSWTRVASFMNTITSIRFLPDFDMSIQTVSSPFAVALQSAWTCQSKPSLGTGLNQALCKSICETFLDFEQEGI